MKKLSEKPKSRSVNLETMEPLIVLGMHRSGTSLVVRLLFSSGIFMGRWLSRDAEAVFFQRLNRQIYSAAGSNWAEINPLLDSMKSPYFIESQAKKMVRLLVRRWVITAGKPGLSDFFGSPLWNSMKNTGSPQWGWKDPRTTLVFPIWLRVFPQARWLHIVRNGIDVAISTHRRSIKQQQKLRNRIFPVDYNSTTLEFDYCFHLWEKYVNFVYEHKPLIPEDRYMEIRYEDLLAAPEKYLTGILQFINHKVDDDIIQVACQSINQSRLDNTTYASAYWDRIPMLANAPSMKKLGYDYPVPKKKQL